MTEPYVPFPMSLMVSYLMGNSNMMPLKSVQAKPGMFEATEMPRVCSFAASAPAGYSSTILIKCLKK